MPIIKTVKGDLLGLFEKGEFDAIAHGCNCFHTMGAGIAKQIAERYPQALAHDRLHHRMGANVIGEYSIANTAFGGIFNLYTQYKPGRYAPAQILENVTKAIYRLDDDLALLAETEKELGQERNFRLGIPLIGCGIAGGNWNQVKMAIDSLSAHFDVVVVEYQAA